jgi:uncharacterized damage-inducible protein DinB
MNILQALRIQAHGNALANHRLHAAMAPLTQADFDAPRTSFFPSLALTLNHILDVDLFYIGALLGEPDLDTCWDRFVPATTLPELAQRQRASDMRLVSFVNSLDEAGVSAEVAMPRGGGRVQRDSAAGVLLHLFQHQTHHRGQAHAMLSGTAVKPPQLDEFMMPSEAHLRTDDMRALGFDEAFAYGAALGR